MLDVLWKFIQLLCTFIMTVGGAGAIVVGIIRWMRKPDTERDETLKKHEDEIKKHEELLARDHRRLQELEEGNKIMMQSMLALMSHSIDGNHIEDLKQARDDLQKYLIRR